MSNNRTNNHREIAYPCVFITFIAVSALLVFLSCATTGKGGKTTSTQVTSRNTDSVNQQDGYGYDASITGSSTSGWDTWISDVTKSLFSFKLPFELSSLEVENLVHGEKELYAGFFGIAFLGAYVGFMVKKIFWRRK